MRIKYANPIRTGATLCNGSPNKAWLCFGIVCILLMKSWGPKRGRGRVQWVSAPEFKPISGPLGSDGLSSHWQPLVGAITQASTTTSMDIPSHELQLFLSPPKSSWSDSQHMDNIQPSMKAGRRKPMTMNKCSGKPPHDSPKELGWSKLSPSSCFPERENGLCRIRWGGRAGCGVCNSWDRLWGGVPRAASIRNRTYIPACWRQRWEGGGNTAQKGSVAGACGSFEILIWAKQWPHRFQHPTHTTTGLLQLPASIPGGSVG